MQDDLYFSMKVLELSRSFRKQMNRMNQDLPYLLRSICLYIQEHPGCCQEEIAAEMMMDKSQLGRNIRKAQQMGLLERKVSPIDNRRAELYLSQQCKEFAEQTVTEIRQWQQGVLSDMTVSEKRQLIYLLERMKTDQ